MNSKRPTPAQSYAENVVAALDSLIAAEPTNEYSTSEVVDLILERPATLRSALNEYLYKLRMQSLLRR